MLNQVVLVGRSVDDVKTVTVESGTKVAHVTLAVQRPFKNENGNYDTDFIKVIFWNFNAEYASKIKKGNPVTVLGRVVTKAAQVDETKVYTLEIIGERLTFIS
jgi:single-strand DNA-binding protein